jgi:hypothetical protein
MKLLPVSIALLITSCLHAQTLDSVDNLVFTIPANWKVSKQEMYTELTTFSKDRYCQVAIYGKQASTADKIASFEKEWSDLVLASFTTTVPVSPKPKQTSNGQSVISFGAPVVSRSNNTPYYVELNMFDCGNSVQSAMVLSGSKEHLQFFDSAWQSLITRVKGGSAKAIVMVKPSVTGYWGKNSKSANGSGYFRTQYDFKTDGTYALRAEVRENDAPSNDYIIIEEKGTYTTLDKQLVIIPSKSKSLLIDAKGNTKKSGNLDMSRRIYTWQWHYSEGSNEHVLVITPVKDYYQDGGYSSSPVFQNAYLLTQDYKPEWKIQPKF